MTSQLRLRGIWEQHDRIWRKLWERTRELMRRAHPETGGCSLLVHNWGNAEAKAIEERAWIRWHKIEAIYERLRDEAEHSRHSDQFRPQWCAHCKKLAS